MTDDSGASDGTDSSAATDAWPTTPPATDLFAEDLLAGETALVTGGGTGIGKAISIAMADHGADVAVASRDMDHLAPVADAVEDRGQRACATTVDVREHDEVETMVETVLDELGEITILVNNAGGNFLQPFEELSPDGWRAVVATILDGTAYCTMEVGQHMVENGGGAVLTMGATNSVRGAPYHAHSGAGKAGVHNLMQTVAARWADAGVRANTIAPGVIRTQGAEDLLAGDIGERIVEEDLAADRLGMPADCVPLALFLASDAAAYVTGGYFAVDGGQLLAPTPF